MTRSGGNCPCLRGTVPASEGQSHFFKGCPSKDLRISIVVPPTDIGYNDRPYMEMSLLPTFFTDVSLLLLVLAGWQLCFRVNFSGFSFIPNGWKQIRLEVL